LVAVWEELLGVERIGIHDNFFELGGHSLLAIRLISAVRKSLMAEVSIGEVFDYPTISSLGKQLMGRSDKGLLQTFTALPRPDRIPLSFAQERLWFIDQLDGSIQYHVPSVLRMKGNLHEEALFKALREIVNRHEVLRTVIEQEDGRPYQRVLEKGGWKLNYLEKKEFGEDRAALLLYADSLINEPFDLSTDHKLRAHLIRLSEQEYLLVVVLHHIASDGWSNDIMVKELIECYGAFADGREPVLAPLPVQYADYAIWQRQYLSEDLLSLKINYWEKKLGGAETLNLPTDFSRPAVQTSRGGMVSFRVPEELSEKLRQLSQKEGVTLFMTLLAVFKVLLYRYSGQPDILVGTVIAGRQQTEAEGLIGFFVNTLVLRSDLADNPDFTSLLQRVKQTALEAYEHQDVPFEKVVEAVVKKRDMSRNALFDVLFILQNNSGTSGTGGVPEGLKGLKIISENSGYTTSKFDLNFSLTEGESNLLGSVEYSTDLFREETINRMAGHFITLLASVVQAPDRRIGDLLLLTEPERQQLVETFNYSRVTYPVNKTVLDLLEEQVKRRPDEIALIFGKDQLTFLGLSERSNQLARYLRKKGVKRESLVAICIERSLDMVIGIWGILKAGGAYVPIDPSYPAERIAYMLGDTEAGFIVTSKACRQNLPSGLGQDALVIELDGDWEKINETSGGKIRTEIAQDQLAYVIYTSGSTGQPKGVMIDHGNVYSFIHWCRQEFSESCFGTVYASTSLCFDLSVFELLYPLTVGKRIRILDNGLSAGKYLPADSLVLLNTVPSVIRFLLEEKTDLNNVSVLNMAGENIPPEVLQRLDINKTEVRNLYGPTETTTYSTCYRIKTREPGLIGKPISNTQIFITDTSGELNPIGVAGELLIGGAGVARGYLNRPDLTAERFIPDMSGLKIKNLPGGGNSKEQKLYKTGDLCRWLPDGNIGYMGRQDAQVKIRGYRVEPGEIEGILELSGLVSQGVVVARSDSGGNKRLVGYVVPKKEFDKDAVIDYLKRQLPEYMVPTLIVKLEQMPLTANGKIDRKGLPDPDLHTILGNAYTEPRTEMEQRLVIIWQSLLHMEKVGVRDNFFELGGHSLLAVQVVSAIRKELSIEIPVKAIFQLSNIELLARFIQIQVNNLVEESDEYETMKL
ncbi:amino acid adenylation domain-containing protein, partial [Flavitalea flava]